MPASLAALHKTERGRRPRLKTPPMTDRELRECRGWVIPLRRSIAKPLPPVTRPTESVRSIEEVLAAVSAVSGLTLAELTTRNRGSRFVLPRQIAIYLAVERTAVSQTKIGYAMGHRDHTTVRHAVKQMRSLIPLDEKARGLYEQAKDLLDS